MTYEMTRKSFLKTVAGAAYGGNLLLGAMSVEDCIADVADMGSGGIIFEKEEMKMPYFSKPVKGKLPPAGMPVLGDIGVRPGNIIMPTFFEKYNREITPYHREFRNNECSVEVANGRAYRRPEYAAEISGEITDTEARNVNYHTKTPELGGFLVRGISRYLISNSKFIAIGNGRNDYTGNGALAMADENAQLTIRNCDFETTGCIRPCTAAGLNAMLKVYESRLKTNGGDWPEGYKETGSGYREGNLGRQRGKDDDFTGTGGNSRPHMSLNSSKSYFYDCEVVSDGWAALSTDAVSDNLYLEANRCKFNVLHSGYATWSDTGARVVFNDCVINCFSLICTVTGEASVDLNGCRSRSGKYGCNMGTNANDAHCCLGDLRVRGGVFSASREAVRIFSQNAHIEFDGVDLNCDSGMLIHSMLAPNPRSSKVEEGEEVYGIKVVLKDMSLSGNIIHDDPHRTMSVSFINSSIRGKIRDAYVSLDKGSRWFASEDSSVGLVGGIKAEQINAPAGVTITAVPAGGCPLSGEYTLTSGGKLIVG